MMQTLLLGAIIVSLAWGAFVFGAVYTWAFTPLAIALAAIGLAALVTGRKGRPPIAGLAAALGAFAVCVSLQLVPLPASVLARVSPGTDGFLRLYDLSYISATTPDPRGELPTAEPRRPISIAPRNTAVGLGLFGAFAVFALGCARLFSRTSVRQIAGATLWLGVSLAAVGIVQDLAIGREVHMKVYGFWQTQAGGNPFGPFINRNHFAGWMLMAFPLAVALVVDQIERALAAMPRESGRGVLELASSPEGGRIVMTAVACMVMGLSLAMTRSRSGVAAFGVSAALLTWCIVRRQASVRARMVVGAAIVAVIGVAMLGAGLNTALGRFAASDTAAGDQTSVGSLGGRLNIWRDTVAMAKLSPLTGQGLNSYGTGTIVFQARERTLHYNEAHNDYLQLAAEGGALLCVPVLAAIGVLVALVRRRFREAPHSGTTYWVRIGAAVGLVSIAVQSAFDFSLQMPGNAALFAMLVGVALHQSPNLRQRLSTGR